MPDLKQLSCSIELTSSGTPLKEYRVVYKDGFVECYVAIPDEPAAFSVHLSSSGFIAQGLAMFVYMDGVYQCNRNRRDLVADSDVGPSSVDFRVRQKEEKKADGMFIGREWRFDKLNIVQADAILINDPDIIGGIGTIEIVVLRCKSTPTDTLSFPRLAREPELCRIPITIPAKAPTLPAFAIKVQPVNVASTKDKPAKAPREKAASVVRPPSVSAESGGGLFGLFDGTSDGSREYIQRMEDHGRDITSSDGYYEEDHPLFRTRHITAPEYVAVPAHSSTHERRSYLSRFWPTYHARDECRYDHSASPTDWHRANYSLDYYSNDWHSKRPMCNLSEEHRRMDYRNERHYARHSPSPRTRRRTPNPSSGHHPFVNDRKVSRRGKSTSPEDKLPDPLSQKGHDLNHRLNFRHVSPRRTRSSEPRHGDIVHENAHDAPRGRARDRSGSQQIPVRNLLHRTGIDPMVPYSIRSQEEEEEEVFPMPGRFINDSGDESRKTQRAVRHRVSSLSGTRASPVGSVHKDISGGFSWGGPKSPDDNHSTQGWPQGDTDENEHKVQWVNGSDQDESKNTLWNSSNSVAGNWNDAKEDSNGSSWAVVRKSSTTRGWDQSKRNKEAKHDNWGSSQPDLGQEGKSKVDGTTENAGGLVSWDNDNNGDDDTWNNDNSWNDATGNNNSWNEYSGNKDTSNNEGTPNNNTDCNEWNNGANYKGDDWNNDTNGNGGGWGTNSNANRNASNDNTNNKMDGWGNKTDNNGGEWNKNIDNNDGGGFNNELIDTDGNNGGFGDLPNSNANPDDSGSTTGWKLDGENRSVAGDWGSKSKSGSQLGGTTEWKADDGKSKVGSQTGGKTEWKEDDGKPTKSDAGSIKSKGPQAVEEAISKVGIHGKAPSKAASDIGAKTNVSRQSRTSNDTYQSGVSNVRVQPYWKKWNTLPPIEEVSSSQRHRSDQIYIAPEHPPMEVDEEVARRMKVENQVRTGPGAKYAHKTARPEYLDAMDKPYAVFRFKYRSKAMLEQILGMKIKEKKVDPRENLRKLSKDEIIEKYLKVKGEDKASVTGSGHSHHEGSHSRTNRRTDHKAPSHASDKPKAANCTGAASKPPSVTSNRQTQCDTPKPPSTTSNKQKDWAPDNQGAEGGALEWDQNANVDWDAGADLTADAEW